MYNVLIIDDHQLIIDAYRKAVDFYLTEHTNVEYHIDETKNCDTALQKIEYASKNKKLDVVFLDMKLPCSSNNEMLCGEELGEAIRKLLPHAKIIVSTSFRDNFRLINMIKKINPDGFLIKGDIVFDDVVNAFKHVLEGETYYSKTVVNLMRARVSNTVTLDKYDIRIIFEISNGARMKDLMEVIPLSKAGIEKRKRQLKIALELEEETDRELILKAREKGFI